MNGQNPKADFYFDKEHKTTADHGSHTCGRYRVICMRQQ